MLLNNNSVSPEITEHIAWLEQATAETMAQIKLTTGEIKCVEDRIRDFLDEYYGEVGKYFGDLDQVNHAIERIQKEANGISESDFDEGLSEGEDCEVYVHHNSIKSKEMKSIFRRLAKYTHPDTSKLSNAQEIFAEASAAKDRGDLCALILLEQNIMEQLHHSDEDPIKRLERFEKKYYMAKDDYAKLLEEKEGLKYSAAYQLWQRVFKERAKGRDVVREVKLNVMQEISAKRKLLAKRRKENKLTPV